MCAREPKSYPSDSIDAHWELIARMAQARLGRQLPHDFPPWETIDAAKEVNSRARHIVVDTIGLLVVVLMTAASMQGRDSTLVT